MRCADLLLVLIALALLCGATAIVFGDPGDEGTEAFDGWDTDNSASRLSESFNLPVYRVAFSITSVDPVARTVSVQIDVLPPMWPCDRLVDRLGEPVPCSQVAFEMPALVLNIANGPDVQVVEIPPWPEDFEPPTVELRAYSRPQDFRMTASRFARKSL
jgi:hypothetical protein